MDLDNPLIVEYFFIRENDVIFLPKTYNPVDLDGVIRSFTRPRRLIRENSVYDPTPFEIIFEAREDNRYGTVDLVNDMEWQRIIQLIEFSFKMVHSDEPMASPIDPTYTNKMDEILYTGTVPGYLPAGLPYRDGIYGYVRHSWKAEGDMVANGIFGTVISFDVRMNDNTVLTFRGYHTYDAFITRRGDVTFRVMEITDTDVPSATSGSNVTKVDVIDVTQKILQIMDEGRYQSFLEWSYVYRPTPSIETTKTFYIFSLTSLSPRPDQFVPMIKKYLLQTDTLDNLIDKYPTLFTSKRNVIIPLNGPFSFPDEINGLPYNRKSLSNLRLADSLRPFFFESVLWATTRPGTRGFEIINSHDSNDTFLGIVQSAGFAEGSPNPIDPSNYEEFPLTSVLDYQKLDDDGIFDVFDPVNSVDDPTKALLFFKRNINTALAILNNPIIFESLHPTYVEKFALEIVSMIGEIPLNDIPSGSTTGWKFKMLGNVWFVIDIRGDLHNYANS